MRPAFLILDGPSEPRAAATDQLAVEGWRVAARCGNADVWAPAGAATPVLARSGQAVVLGRRLWSQGRDAAYALPRDTGGEALIARLLREAWGDYVALVRDPAGTCRLLRDPSGGVEVLTWRTREGLALATSDFARTPSWLRPARPGLAWDRIATFLNATSAGASASLLDGVDALPPGGVAPLGDGAAPRLAWRPADFAAPTVTDIAEAEAELVRRVDAATAGLAAGHQRLIFELSGGLDSSIVAAAMGHTGAADRVVSWCNAVSDRPDGDERRYARAVADRLGVTATFLPQRIVPLQVDDVEALAGGIRPATSGVDAATDRALADQIRAAAATGVISGQGGDATFYQMPSNYLVNDLLRRDGLNAVLSAGVAAMARRRRRPAWAILREAWADRTLSALPPRTNRFLTAAAADHVAGARHPWEADSLDLPLSKQLQIRGLSQGLAPRGDSRRARAAPILCPLLAQPVIEFCLAIPAIDLALGGQDRPLARRAFAARLPPAVLHRRSKGEVTAYFARTVAASADMLRPYLLEGNLVAAGVLDRRAVAEALDPAQLIYAPRPAELLMAAATEAWVRHWQTQVPDAPARGPWRR